MCAVVVLALVVLVESVSGILTAENSVLHAGTTSTKGIGDRAPSTSSATTSFTSMFDPVFTRKAIVAQMPSDCDPSAVANWSCKPCSSTPGMTNISSFVNASHGTQAYVGYLPQGLNKSDSESGRIVVAIRGSHDLLNWIEDFNFKRIVYDLCENTTGAPNPMPPRTGTSRKTTDVFQAQQQQGKLNLDPSSTKTTATGHSDSTLNLGARDDINKRCLVHEGFFLVWQDIESDIIAAVEALLQQHPTAPVLVVGHSLGAAVATHAALQLAAALPSPPATAHRPSAVDQLITIASPRVGNPVFAKWASTFLSALQVNSIRLTHNSDLVPKLPLQSMGFLHIPHEVWFPYGHVNQPYTPDDALYKECHDSDTAEDPTCSNSVIIQDVVLLDHMEMMGIQLGCKAVPPAP